MRRTHPVILAVVASLWLVGPATAAGCQKNVASAPYIGAADLRIIDRAVLHLPAERPAFVHLSVGAPVPRSIARKPLPAAVSKILPQYKGSGYAAFRVGQRLAIVDRRGVLVYILPIGHPARPGNCP